MIMNNEFDKTLSPAYNRENGVTLFFLISVFFCSNIRTTKRQLIYIFYIINDQEVVDYLKHNKSLLTDQYLLNKIFNLSNNKKYFKKGDIRSLVGLKKDTFNKYFGKYLEKCGLSKTRVYSLEETYKILSFWQGDDKWDRMKAFTKKELISTLSMNYETLEVEMTNEVFSIEEYKNQDYFKVADVKKYFGSIEEKVEVLLKKDFNCDYLFFFFCSHLLGEIHTKYFK